MPKQKLEVFARIKPSSIQSQTLPIGVRDQSTITIQTNRAKLSSLKQQHDFGFNLVFEQETNQDLIFNTVARPVIDNCLEGYNGTIFAYGQTGSGKTFTMSGGDEWETRGIIPRVIGYVFGQFDRAKHIFAYELSVSYLEIYNQAAYDLLNQHNSEKAFQQWPKITFMQDEDNRFYFKNGTSNLCKTEDQALDYFMMGNYFKKVSCTHMNQVSSRSHCIFILNIKGTNLQTLTQVYSKINLVDLAGSERVSKSHAQGLILTQAKSINLSLSYLQQVIVSLNQKAKGKSKTHVPYRNSLLTTLLKDSLGGNCKTVMIATISSQMQNIEETLSTLRFSQRVRQIRNEVSKNEKNSNQAKLEMLERENQLLKKKLQTLMQNQQFKRTDSEQIRALPMTKPNQRQVHEKVVDFMNEKITQIKVEHVDHANIYFKKLKDLYRQKMKQYVKELNFISQKIINYEEMLDEREKNCFREVRS